MTTDELQAVRPIAETVMIAGFVVLASLVWIGVQVLLNGGFDPIAMTIGVVALAGAGLVASGRRWGLIAATVLAGLMLLFDLPMFLGHLTSPDEPGWVVVSVLGLAAYLVILGAGARAVGLGRGSR